MGPLKSFLPHVSCININHINFKYLFNILGIRTIILDIDDTLTI